MDADAPVMTNVSVEKTGSKAGEILVSWHPPLSLDSILFPKPYKYILRRYYNFSSNDNEFTFSIQEDTFFVDMDLNYK